MFSRWIVTNITSARGTCIAASLAFLAGSTRYLWTVLHWKNEMQFGRAEHLRGEEDKFQTNVM
jgi:hypothetical protein